MEAPIIVLDSNNGDISSREVMMHIIVQALTGLGLDVCIVGPAEPSVLIDSARSIGLQTLVLEAF